MAELAANQIALSDGKVLEMREINGADEMIVGAYLGDAMEANAGSALMFQNCLVAQSVVSVDGQARPALRSFEDYRNFLATFRGKDWTRAKKLFDRLNGDDAEGNGLDAKSKFTKNLGDSTSA